MVLTKKTFNFQFQSLLSYNLYQINADMLDF